VSSIIEKELIVPKAGTNTRHKTVCGSHVIHLDLVRKAGKSLPREEVLYELSDFFKIFGDSTRIKILWTLFISPMCVCDISAVLGMEQSAVSHQLRILKQSRLVKYKREGKVIYYSLNDDHVKGIINMALEHLKEI